MFEWKVENLALRSERPKQRFGNSIEYRFSADREVSREDKIAFLDKMNNNTMSYLLDLIEKYDQESQKMPKDQWGSVKTVSLIGWCKRNDKSEIIDRSYRYGRFYIAGCERYIHEPNRQGHYDTYSDLVDEAFHRQLIRCLNEEDGYFEAHDEYEIAKTTIREYSNKYNTCFGLNLAFSSDGSVMIVEEEDSWKGPQITLDQCNMLIELYKKLDKETEHLTAECNAKIRSLA